MIASVHPWLHGFPARRVSFTKALQFGNQHYRVRPLSDIWIILSISRMSYPFISYDVCWLALQLRPCQTMSNEALCGVTASLSWRSSPLWAGAELPLRRSFIKASIDSWGSSHLILGNMEKQRGFVSRLLLFLIRLHKAQSLSKPSVGHSPSLQRTQFLDAQQFLTDRQLSISIASNLRLHRIASINQRE